MPCIWYLQWVFTYLSYLLIITTCEVGSLFISISETGMKKLEFREVK